MSTFASDVRYCFRMLRKRAGFTAVAVLSLTIGIGANTAVFSLFDAVLLRALPVPNARELRAISWEAAGQSTSNYHGGVGSQTFPYPAYETFRDHATGFSDVFAFATLYDVTAVTPTGTLTVQGTFASGNYFSGYGARALIGRTLRPEDDRPDAAPVTVITYRAWNQYFGLDPTVIGQTVALNKTGFTIIGVLPRDCGGLISGDPADFYVPFVAQPQLKPNCSLTSAENWWVQIVGRRTPESSETQAQASLSLLLNRFLETSRDSLQQPRIVLLDAKCGLGGQTSAQPLWAMQALVFLVLLIACANLASLLLAHGAARRREMTVRAALGAGRWRLTRQLLTESLVLSVAGAALGLLVAAWMETALVNFLSRTQEGFRVVVRTDAHVLAFTVVIAVVTTVLCGLIPAWRAGRVDPSTGLKESDRQAAPRLRLGKVLVATQVGLAVILVFGTGLLIQTLVNLRDVQPGFDVENLLVFRLNPTQAGYQGQDRAVFYDRVCEAISGVPGSRSVAFSSVGLLSGGMEGSSISIPRWKDSSAKPFAHMLTVSDGFFQTMGIPLLSGRHFDASDTPGAVHAAIVNEAFVRAFFPDGEALGQNIKMGETEHQIVGVCRDAHYRSLRDAVPPTMYFSYRQHPSGTMTFAVRSMLPPMSLLPAVRRLVADIDRSIPLEKVATQEEIISRSVMAERLFATLCGSLALMAVALSCIGLYALMTYHVARRTPEIGVRLALGARPRDVAWPIVRDALVLATCGMAIGLPVAVVLMRLARSVFFEIRPHDPMTVAASTVLLLGVAALATWIPARRAAKIDPMVALRCE